MPEIEPLSQEAVVQLAEQRLAPAKKSVALPVLKWVVRSAATSVLCMLVLQVVGVMSNVLGPMLKSEYPPPRWVSSSTGRLMRSSWSSSITVVEPLHWLAVFGMTLIYSALVRPRLFGNGFTRGFMFGVGVWVMGLLIGLVTLLSGKAKIEYLYVPVFVAMIGGIYATL